LWIHRLGHRQNVDRSWVGRRAVGKGAGRGGGKGRGPLPSPQELKASMQRWRRGQEERLHETVAAARDARRTLEAQARRPQPCPWNPVNGIRRSQGWDTRYQ